MLVRVALAVYVAVFATVANSAPAATATNHWFTVYNAASLRTVAAARAAIRLENVDRELLDAAVFHETNRRRVQHKLPMLAFSAKAREAARLQSEAMAKHGFVSHTNEFDPAKRTLMERAQLAGIRPMFIAENVASAFAREYRSGDTVYVRNENGRKIVSAIPTGPELRMRSYLEFAEALVTAWMNSPGHRKNILHSAPKNLGVSCIPTAAQKEIETLHCTQVFTTERE